VRYLLEDFGVAAIPGQAFVAAIPGQAFEYDPNFRISYATSMAKLERACARIENACKALV